MHTNLTFYLEARDKFPTLAEKADREYFKDWGEQPSADNAYIWFHSVANALNKEMRRGTCLEDCDAFFDFVTRVFDSASVEVKQCIDVSLVENLFWRVQPAKAAAYWDLLPSKLQALYVGFHNTTPL